MCFTWKHCVFILQNIYPFYFNNTGTQKKWAELLTSPMYPYVFWRDEAEYGVRFARTPPKFWVNCEKPWKIAENREKFIVLVIVRRFSYECIIYNCSVFIGAKLKYGVGFARKPSKLWENPRKIAINREKSHLWTIAYVRNFLMIEVKKMMNFFTDDLLLHYILLNNFFFHWLLTVIKMETYEMLLNCPSFITYSFFFERSMQWISLSLFAVRFYVSL